MNSKLCVLLIAVIAPEQKKITMVKVAVMRAIAGQAVLTLEFSESGVPKADRLDYNYVKSTESDDCNVKIWWSLLCNLNNCSF